MFQLAELDSSRAGKIGMEVGSIREKIIIALLIYKFGQKNIKTDIPITQSEVDVEQFDEPLSIKTITGKIPSGVKLIWTVDAKKAREFSRKYNPKCGMIFVQVVWNQQGGLYFIPLSAQRRLFKKIGRHKYLKLPKAGTNPRGVEMTKEAMIKLLQDRETKTILIDWRKTQMKFNAYKKWVDLWKEQL